MYTGNIYLFTKIYNILFYLLQKYLMLQFNIQIYDFGLQLVSPAWYTLAIHPNSLLQLVFC